MKTFKASNDENARTGNVEVQPSESGSQKLDQQSVNSGKDIPPPTEQTRSEVFTAAANARSEERAKTVTDLINSFSDPDAIVSTLRGSGFNQITPYNPSVDYDSILKENEKLTSTSKRIEAYEQFTGISKERPEIVMLTDFQPLYTLNSSSEDGKSKLSYRSFRPSLTNAGRFFEQQLQIRTLRSHNMKHMIVFNKKASPGFRKLSATRKEKFYSEMESLSTTAHYLLGITRTLDGYKQQLDVKDNSSVVTPDEVLRHHLVSFSKIKSSQVLKYLTSSLNTNFLSKYDIHYALGLFGFDSKKTKSYYTSTKNWLQLNLELKNILTTHSLSLLDLPSLQQKNDESPLKLLKTPGLKRFQYSTKNFNHLRAFSELKDLKIPDLPLTLQAIMSAYTQLYESVNFRNQEMRLAGLVNLVSQEYRYSRGLGDKEVQKRLDAAYGYKVSTENNLNVFDYVIGQFGDNITEVLSPSRLSLASVAQIRLQDDNTVMLPFESRYIEGDRGTLIPGSEYLADSILSITNGRYDITRLKEFHSNLTAADGAFHSIVNSMNLLSNEYVDDSSYDSASFSTRLNNPRSLFNAIRKTFISDNGLPNVILQRDPLAPVFAMAHDDPKIKSLLFLYLLMRVSRAYHPSSGELLEEQMATVLPSGLTGRVSDVEETDNTPASEEVIRQLISAVVDKSKLSSTFNVNNAPGVNAPVASSTTNNNYFVKVDAIAASLRSSSELLLSCEQLIKEVITEFKSSCLTPNTSTTRYSGRIDTVILMSVFDVISTVISVYGNKHIVGYQEGGGQRSFIVQDRVDEHTRALNEIDGRISKEIVLAQHAIFFVFNMLRKLQNSSYNVMGYVNSPSSLAELDRIYGLLGNDSNLLKMLFTEQQIRLFANSVADVSAILRSTAQNSGFSGEDVDGDGDFDADDEVKVLDDSVLTPKVRDAIEALMTSTDYAIKPEDHKIMTVGIPIGFVENLKQKIDQKKFGSKNLDARQNDIIKLKVYKIDLLNPDIVYKPKEFLFEMSRFVARADDLIKPTSAQTGDILDITRRFPTRDYSQAFSSGGADVQYLQSQKDESEALGSPDYSFLTQKEKNSLLTNHVVSYLLESYLKVMTGASTADHHFDISPPPRLVDQTFIENVVNNHVSNFVALKKMNQGESEKPSQGSLLFSSTQQRFKKKSKDASTSDNSQTPYDGYTNAAGTAGVSSMKALSQYKNGAPLEKQLTVQPSQTITQSSSQLKMADIPAITHQLGVINEFSRTLTPLSDPGSVSQRLIRPKLFDRVFNVLIDPHSFEINLDVVNRTPHGKQALELLVNKGDVLLAKKMSTEVQGSKVSTKRFESRPRSKSQGDIMFEKYFVAIETIDGEES